MRYVSIRENINLGTASEVSNSTDKTLSIVLICDDSVIQLNEEDLKKIGKLVDTVKYAMGG